MMDNAVSQIQTRQATPEARGEIVRLRSATRPINEDEADILGRVLDSLDQHVLSDTQRAAVVVAVADALRLHPAAPPPSRGKSNG